MPKNQPQELGTGQRPDTHLLGFAVLVTESDLAIPAGNNILFLDNALIKITSEINQRFVAAANGLAVHHPGFRVAGRKLQSLLADGLKQFGAENFSQRFVIEQIAFWLLP